MALIEYVIQYKNGKAHVTYNVLEVDTNDRIVFTSNYPEAGIKYKKGSPFSGSSAPQADVVFEVGKGTKGPFTVTQKLTDDNRLEFECGEIVAVTGTSTIGGAKHQLGLNSWNAGDGTPPPKG